MESSRFWMCCAGLLVLATSSSLSQEQTSDQVLNSGCLANLTLEKYKRVADGFQTARDGLSMEDFHNLLMALQKNPLPTSVMPVVTEHPCKETTTPSGNEEKSFNCSGCLTVSDIYYHYRGNQGLNYTNLPDALQQAVLSVVDPACAQEPVESNMFNKPTTGQAWGYGSGFVCLICIISNIGGLLTPVMSKKFFQRILQFLVAMGAGTLAATGLLVLIPEAFHIASCEHLAEDYIWKAATALISIYVFFTSERLLKCLLRGKELERIRRQESFTVDPPTEDEKVALTNFEDKENQVHGHSHFPDLSIKTIEKNVDGEVKKKKKKNPVKTVAWMVLIGDVIHNFVDGLAIGAAFTENVYMGVSISIAVLCEELPHELGDIAILLHSGMSMRRALFLNFLSACVCFIGLVLGIVLGENTEANRWILAVAGGLFLYVPLVDMLPEMSEILDLTMKESVQENKGAFGNEFKHLMFLQGLGFLLGMAIILSVVYCTGHLMTI
ncbi:zinc transporter ZIP8-like [Pomacea canaliculata]|uniref:zinc transporter ZIP8-like n=1 Tax=Pomacea canaliculata TaxID=400727 RepID=UPI000D72BD2F|nr:zinc transporter ZIP8-like [Pomacea canaliculata]XP_025087061.1 zinc transporter ZIP8-like [Pomacea canaliculata]